MVTPVNPSSFNSYSGGQPIEDSLNQVSDQLGELIDQMSPGNSDLQDQVQQLNGMYNLFEEIKTTLHGAFPNSFPQWAGNYYNASDRLHDAYNALQAAIKNKGNIGAAIQTLQSKFSDLNTAMGPVSSYFNSNPPLFNQLVSDQIVHKLSYSNPKVLHFFNGRGDRNSLNELQAYMTLFNTLAECPTLPAGFQETYNGSFQADYNTYKEDPTNPTNLRLVINDLNQMNSDL
jgi:hypothetical protein